ncbi:MAG: beta-galactosidase [Candidatus Hydrogenedentes bacterium]|nr:beta-galactosidase [Candidatus Hydrogenedentota bacterium]
MSTYEGIPADKTTSLSPSLRAARLFAWGEVFILIPMHAFWMLSRSTPFVAENTASAMVAAVPIVVLILAGLAAQFARVRAALLRAEWLFHLTAAGGMFLLLTFVTVRDPFRPALPITWPLCFWSVCMTFACLANIALHERIGARTGGKAAWASLLGIVLAVAAWAMFIWIASGMTWAPYFWSVALVFHATMAVHSRRTAPSFLGPAKRLQSATALLESLFVMSLILAAFLRFTLTCEQIGRVELKYIEFVNMAASPMFFAGFAVALLAARFRFAFLTHAALAAVFFFTDQTVTWPIALALGYALPILYLVSTREGAFSYALTFPIIVLIWVLAMLGFGVAGVIIEYHMHFDFLMSLIARLRLAIPVLYGVFLIFGGISFFWSRRMGEFSGSRDSVPGAGVLAGIFAYAGAWIAILVPTLYLVVTTMSPPVFFEPMDRINVGEASGVCHAGYSESDEEYANLHKLGVDLMRIDFHWRRIQPGPDTWDFNYFDSYLDTAEKHGINVLALLVYDNNAVERNERGAEKGKYIAPEDVPLYLEYIRRTVTRYKNRVYAWELWNEPDIPRFWDGPSEELYALIGKAAKTVRESDPNAILLGPAMTSPLGVWSAKGIEHLHAIGALKHVNHPTMHTYVSEPRAYYNEFLRVRNAAAKYGHPGAVWITELGDPDGGVYPWRGSREHLAVHVMKAYTIATRMGIEKLVWYCYQDSGFESLRENPKNSERFFGLTKSDGSWKPAAYAYSLFSEHCTNSTIRQDLVRLDGGLAARQLRAVLYRRDGGESALVLWFEPGLRPGAHARVSIDLGALDTPATLHRITDGDTKSLLDPLIDVTEKPTLITFTAPDSETPVQLEVETSPADMAWLLLALGFVVGAACLTSAGQGIRRHSERQRRVDTV